jgi:hypothetical protein
MTWYYGVAADYRGLKVKMGWTGDPEPHRRCSAHRRERTDWALLGWHDGSRADEQRWHDWARQAHDPVNVLLGSGDREWYWLTDDLLHVIHFNLIHRPGRATVEPAFWPLWEPRHDVDPRRRCRALGCREGVAA